MGSRPSCGDERLAPHARDPGPVPIAYVHLTHLDPYSVVRCVTNGEFGNGDARKQKLGSSYSTVRKHVNEILV